MSALVAGYGSSDDEDQQPVASTSRAALDNGRPALPHQEQDGNNDDDDDEEDDDALEAAARADVFGVKTAVSTQQARHQEAQDSQRQLQVAAAPDVVAVDKYRIATREGDKVMYANVKYDDLQMQVMGPRDAYDMKKNRGMNTVAGHVEEQAMDDQTFLKQLRTFDVHGYAMNPSLLPGQAGAPIVGSVEAAYQNGFATIDGIRSTKAVQKEMKRKRNAKGDASVVEGDGAYMGPWAKWQSDEVVDEVLEEEAEEWRAEKKRREEESTAAKERQKRANDEKSVFHGKSLTDYAGRTYMHIPTDTGINLNPSEETPAPESFLPKRCVHTWTGHTKAVSAIRLFPKSGHLLLSSSMDTKVKLWDVYHEGNCLRTFMGHGKAVKDITFNNDGTRFLTASYDRHVKLWDTESGKCIQAFSNGKVPHVVKFHPDEDKQHIFLAGMQDKKIIQYDLNAQEITQTYDQHLGPVNTITFVDDNRRFVTTSDDKTIRAWDYDIPVVIKYIAEPYMHSMPAVTLHPNQKWLAGQSLDNQILIYSTDGFRQNRKKRFAGHSVAGYACAVGFSPDGRFVSSGESGGNMVFWDWRTGKILKRLQAHSKVVIDHVWLPNESSKLITASWDGLIKLWE